MDEIPTTPEGIIATLEEIVKADNLADAKQPARLILNAYYLAAKKRRYDAAKNAFANQLEIANPTSMSMVEIRRMFQRASEWIQAGEDHFMFWIETERGDESNGS